MSAVDPGLHNRFIDEVRSRDQQRQREAEEKDKTYEFPTERTYTQTTKTLVNGKRKVEKEVVKNPYPSRPRTATQGVQGSVLPSLDSDGWPALYPPVVPKTPPTAAIHAENFKKAAQLKKFELNKKGTENMAEVSNARIEKERGESEKGH